MASNDLYDQLRALILDVAASNDKIGPLEESLKWGEPSFTPAKKNVGSSVRLVQREEEVVAMMFICTTKLVDRFREIYPSDFTYEGSRALVVSDDASYDSEKLKHCIAMALTYKLKS